MEIYFLNTSKLEIEREGKINRFDYTNKTFLLGNKSWGEIGAVLGLMHSFKNKID